MVSGAQKAFSIPPGLAFVAANARAWERYKVSDHPKYYFDLGREKKKQPAGETAFTPGISMVLALQEVLRMMRAEGLEGIWARHARYSQAARRGAEALGLTLYTESPSFAVTAVVVPQGVSAPAVVKRCRDKHGVTFAGGQDDLKDTMIRIGHLGYIGERDLIAGMSALEQSLREEGVTVPGVGEGVRAAQAALLGL
jgi:serine---pyruvate transaminase